MLPVSARFEPTEGGCEPTDGSCRPTDGGRTELSWTKKQARPQREPPCQNFPDQAPYVWSGVMRKQGVQPMFDRPSLMCPLFAVGKRTRGVGMSAVDPGTHSTDHTCRPSANMRV